MISNEIEKKLKEKGYKLTYQRKAILEILIQHEQQFLTAEEIYIKVKKDLPQINFSTVYRNLEILEKINMIHKINIENKPSQYELILHDDHHHHVICKSCGKTQPIHFCPLKQIIESLEDKDFTLTEHKFELYGYCSNCTKKNKE
ncbi:Fur family transcriptional regulator [Inediibacterium massiliense]|uniref:Fur family transcriptional regulator n=1 Tax=Inediibacterium massiliense TaxID=1658111 RepID=UPI0006B5AE56|nr:Fur family transcriptional regulator [Inediibacterium massiliense]